MEEKEFDYINVIPLVDVMLVLLTIVLTTATFIASGVIPINLPKASKSYDKEIKTQTIEINKEANIYLNSVPVTIKGLKKTLNSINRNTPILIRADRDITLQIFIDVLDVIKGLNFKKISIQTEEKEG